MAKEELIEKIAHLSTEHKNQVLQLIETLIEQEQHIREMQSVNSLMTLSVQSFNEWDNEEDSIYDSL